MTLRPVFYIIGLMLVTLGIAMLIPAAVVVYEGSYDWGGFVYGSVATLFIGVMMTLANQHSLTQFKIGVREAFLLTVLIWIFTVFFASLPFLLGSHPHSLVDSLFESTSALTTTGATIIKNLDRTNSGILLWRGILQWLGSVGIIVMALTIFPMLRIGGMQLFRTESSDRSEKILPRVSQIAGAIMTIQAVFTAVFFLALWCAGLSPLDAACHAMGGLTTGGLSTSAASIGNFSNPTAEIIIIAGMFIGSCTLLLFIRVWQGDWRAFVNDPQIRGFTSIILIASLILALWRIYHNPQTNVFDIMRECLFTVLSITSSTGYTVADYSTWGGFPTLLIFMLTFIGGCTGSTTGGLKIFRIQVLWTILKNQMAQVFRPHGIFLSHYNNKVLSDSVINSVFTFFSLFGLTYASIILLLGLCGVDMLTCLSAGAAALTNTGVGIGPIIGPSGSYAALSDPAKWVLMFGMLMGRLEMMAVVALLSSRFWRQ